MDAEDRIDKENKTPFMNNLAMLMLSRISD